MTTLSLIAIAFLGNLLGNLFYSWITYTIAIKEQRRIQERIRDQREKFLRDLRDSYNREREKVSKYMEMEG